MKKVCVLSTFILSLIVFAAYLTPKVYAQGTCKWLPDPPLRAEDHCDTGYAPTQSGSVIAPNCVCSPIDPKNSRQLPKILTSCSDVKTAIGIIPTCDLNKFAAWILGWTLGIAGGIAFLLIIKAGFQIMTSSGNPDRLKDGQEQLTAAITGLLFLVFSVFLLKLIGFDILHLPGFGTP